MSGSTKQIIYALLAGTGLLLTWTFNIRFMLEQGTAIGSFITAAYSNAAAASLTNDVAIAAIAFMFWSWFESRRLGMRHWWRWPVLTCGIALAFALPLFLLLRERALQQEADQV